MAFGLSGRRPNRVVMSSPNHMSEKFCCMVLRLNIDCNACCRKLRRIVLRMKEVETHMIEKQQRRIIVCGRFVPSDVAIKIRKKMNRRVQILEIQELGNENNNDDNNNEQETENPEQDHHDENHQKGPNNNINIHNNPPPPMVVYPGQAPSSSFQFHPASMPMAYCRTTGYYSTMGITHVWGNNSDEYLNERDDDELPCDEDQRRRIEMTSWENYID